MNNIFLTGEKGIGKSTIVNRFVNTLEFLPGGFQTLMFSKDESGLYTLIIRPYKLDLAYEKGTEPEGDDFSIVATRENLDQFMTVNKDAFDFTGVNILRRSLEKENTRLIIMDELGFMEKDATIFQAEVFKCLDSETPVLGVLKEGSMPFLDAISEREDVVVIEVTNNNRDQVFTDMAIARKYAELANCWR